MLWLFCWHLSFFLLYNGTQYIYRMTHQSVGFTIKEQRECHFSMSVLEQLLYNLCLSLSYSINVKQENKCIRSEYSLLSYPDTPFLSLVHIKEVVPGPLCTSAQLASGLVFCVYITGRHIKYSKDNRADEIRAKCSRLSNHLPRASRQTGWNFPVNSNTSLGSPVADANSLIFDPVIGSSGQRKTANSGWRCRHLGNGVSYYWGALSNLSAKLEEANRSSNKEVEHEFAVKRGWLQIWPTRSCASSCWLVSPRRSTWNTAFSSDGVMLVIAQTGLLSNWCLKLWSARDIVSEQLSQFLFSSDCVLPWSSHITCVFCRWVKLWIQVKLNH